MSNLSRNCNSTSGADQHALARVVSDSNGFALYEPVHSHMEELQEELTEQDARVSG
jgi:hypothetical protein